MRRRFHGSESPMDRSWQMRECKPGSLCAGRMHFYAFTDHDAEALFDILDAHHRSGADPKVNDGSET